MRPSRRRSCSPKTSGNTSVGRITLKARVYARLPAIWALAVIRSPKLSSDPRLSVPGALGARPWPVLGPYQTRINDLLEQNSRLPPKQRLTAHRIYELLRDDGFPGCESRVRQYISERKQVLHPPDRFIPLAFEPGQDAQVDWGEAQVLFRHERQTVQLFVMRLCYSRRIFVMAFPSQKQECFFYGHVLAFQHFGGIPARLSYDNLATAVKLALDHGEVTRTGKRRHEQHHFVALRSHYLFGSHFCTPGQAHEKGGVEHGVGYVRRNYLTPLLDVSSFDELNAELLRLCRRDDQRRVTHQSATIGEMWEAEKATFTFPATV